MLAAMAVPVGPIEYHLTLAGPVGVLLGGAGAFQVAFIVSAILALIGHGGLTAIGLNALLVGLAAGVARALYPPLRARMGAATSLAIATAAGQAIAALGWFVVVVVAVAGRTGDTFLGVSDAADAASSRLTRVLVVGVPIVLAGIAAEAVVAFGLGRFLARVRPELLDATHTQAVSAPPTHGVTAPPTHGVTAPPTHDVSAPPAHGESAPAQPPSARPARPAPGEAA
jgi:cobalt/nickel transport system permease protein